MGRKSISQRLASTRSAKVKLEIAQDWADNWECEQASLLRELGLAVKNDDYNSLCIITGELKAVTEKRFPALKKVINEIWENPKEQS